ncbi:MAG: integron integrase [Candidatus Krumholzibacteria bacterium]|nr:integron integrase [Candidatus Krumholzibacteria bacterium]
MVDSEPEKENQEKPRLLTRIRDAMRLKHHSARTEKAYIGWIKRFIRFHNNRHPSTLAEPEVTAFLTHLAVVGKVSPSTQSQALAALLFLYRQVLKVEMPWLDSLVRAKPRVSLPVVMSREEVRMLLGELDGLQRLMAAVLYGTGMRLMECCQLRIKDVDFYRHQMTVRRGKGGKDRAALFPKGLEKDLRRQIWNVTGQHEADLAKGGGWVLLEEGLTRKYPNAGRELGWQWVFPATRVHVDQKTGHVWRHHLHQSVLQRAVKEAARRAKIQKRVTCHILRHSFATHLLEDGSDIRTIQQLMGHKDVRTTMKYLHLLDRGPLGVRSPLDRL